MHKNVELSKLNSCFKLNIYFIPSHAAKIISAAFSPTMIVGALIFVFAIVGITDASATLNPFTPFTLKLFKIISHNFDTFQFHHICFVCSYIYISYVHTSNGNPKLPLDQIHGPVSVKFFFC